MVKKIFAGVILTLLSTLNNCSVVTVHRIFLDGNMKIAQITQSESVANQGNS